MAAGSCRGAGSPAATGCHRSVRSTKAADAAATAGATLTAATAAVTAAAAADAATASDLTEFTPGVVASPRVAVARLLACAAAGCSPPADGGLATATAAAATAACSHRARRAAEHSFWNKIDLRHRGGYRRMGRLLVHLWLRHRMRPANHALLPAVISAAGGAASRCRDGLCTRTRGSRKERRKAARAGASQERL